MTDTVTLRLWAQRVGRGHTVWERGWGVHLLMLVMESRPSHSGSEVSLWSWALGEWAGSLMAQPSLCPTPALVSFEGKYSHLPCLFFPSHQPFLSAHSPLFYTLQLLLSPTLQMGKLRFGIGLFWSGRAGWFVEGRHYG